MSGGLFTVPFLLKIHLIYHIAAWEDVPNVAGARQSRGLAQAGLSLRYRTPSAMATLRGIFKHCTYVSIQLSATVRPFHRRGLQKLHGSGTSLR